MTSILKNKSILVTGGTGTIGSALVKQAIIENAKKIIVFSNDENGLFELEEQFSNHKNIEYVIGDIRNEDIVSSIIKNIDIVFHAAALKHVDRCESNPFEAITVNTIGTRNVIKYSIIESVKKVILISTDKAVNPIGVMGATKLLAEKLMSSEGFQQNSKTILATVRFGNVIKSRGSILPKIEKQIAKGGPITLTDQRMMRFFMSEHDAINLILSAADLAKGGEIFVSKMPLLNLKELFETMKEILAPKFGHDPNKIKMKTIGIRPGEKLIEFLLNNTEMENALETKNFFIIPPISKPERLKKYVGAKKAKNIQNYFEKLQPISKKEIKNLLKQSYES
ncbi:MULTISPECIES: polysaccharide biosynthesis protein [Nitrosopumilus]|nr:MULTISPECIES: polysaccharide biosynthesis protein [Nitrosopumilus]